MDENNTTNITAPEKRPRKLLPIKIILLFVVLVIGLVGGWLFLQQEKTIEVENDFAAQVGQDRNTCGDSGSRP
jgi:flagellar basal body-associated protein FliL